MQTRRTFTIAAASWASALSIVPAAVASSDANKPRKARIAITFDLEMSRNFPRWEDTHWDYEKGNLDTAAKRYSVEAARRVKAVGGVMHFFAVGRVLEQENIDWLKQLVAEGHPIGNHTYDHVKITATRLDEVQHRFQRSPWLAGRREVAEIIRENIRLCTEAMQNRLGITPAGFRSPGGFGNGMADRPDLRNMLRDQGFHWISTKYPRHAISEPGTPPTPSVFDSILEAQSAAQPFRYDDGMIELPMSPISDIGAFRTGRWKLEDFLTAIRRSVEQAIAQGMVFDFLAHPSCLGVVDPEFRTVDLICELVSKASDRAEIVSLETVAGSLAG